MQFGRFIVIIALITLVEWMLYALRLPLSLSNGGLVPLLLATSATKFMLVVYWVMRQIQTSGATPSATQKTVAAVLVMGGGTALILWILLVGQPVPG